MRRESDSSGRLKSLLSWGKQHGGWAGSAVVAAALGALHLFTNGVDLGSKETVLDEAGTWGVAAHGLGRLLTLPTEFHSQPPLYYIVLHGLLHVNDSPWFMRGFSWLCCLAGVLFVWFGLHELNRLARVFLAVLLIKGALMSYLAGTVRPYGMAFLCVLMASVLLLRLLRAPGRRVAYAYAAWALAMVYTMAFDVAVLAVHSAAVAVFVGLDTGQRGFRQAWLRDRPVILAWAAVVAGYVPYLAMAIHYQYHRNAIDTWNYVFTFDTYQNALRDLFQLAQPALYTLYALCALALVEAIAERRGAAGLWLLMAVAQIAFVYFFIVGRSPIGAQGKYMMPAFVAVALLAALGFHRLTAKAPAFTWIVAGGLLFVCIKDSWGAYSAAHSAHRPPLPFEVLHQRMAMEPGNKIIFFDIGYDGQHLEYVVRHDPSITTATQRGTGWGSGGGNHLDDSYIIATIEATTATTRCYFYYLEYPTGPFARAFLPKMKSFGYRPLADVRIIHGHRVPGFCQDLKEPAR